MKKHIVVLAMIALFVLSFRISGYTDEIAWQDIGSGNLNLKSVLLHPDNPRIIYIGSNNAIFKSEDGGENWRSVLFIKGKNPKVNFLIFDPKDNNSLYAASETGLFYSQNHGKDWKRVFRGKNYLENDCRSLAVVPSGIYLGTRGGLFVSYDKGSSWHKEKGELGNACILAIASSLKEPDYIYVVSRGCAFRTQNQDKAWEKIFIAGSRRENNNEEASDIDIEKEDTAFNFRHIAVDPDNSNYLYLATSSGVYQSQDKGYSWIRLPTYGLLTKDTRFLLLSNNHYFYTLTKSGIFTYKNQRWQELSLRLVAGEINFLACDNKGNLYAACDKGLFRAAGSSIDSEQRIDVISLYYQGEPGINEIQQAAIKYAEVEAGKIKEWRRRAQNKAWLPKVSVGVDTNASDLWHWETGSTTKNDDDILRRGKDAVEWNVNLSWDLGEVVWNSDQTSIDVRSKLMVELREEILDQVTKIYFERLRLKMELDNLSIEDRRKRFEKELRIKEFTANLDAMTGNFFSKRCPQ